MPVLQQLYSENLREGDVAVIGVTIRTTPDEARQFNERLGIDFPTVHDEGGGGATSYQIGGVPTYVFWTKRAVSRSKAPAPGVWRRSNTT